jgi:hypothetical protein
LFLAVSFQASGQLSGVYTISRYRPASATCYKSFSAAVADLVTGVRTDTTTFSNGPGVNGPVSFLVDTGNYAEQVRIPGISGVSVANTITFEGMDASHCVLTFAASVKDTCSTLLLNGCSFIRIRNLSIQCAGYYGNAIQALNNTNNISINHCDLQPFTGAPLQTSSVAGYGILFSNSFPATSGGGKFDSIYIDSCRITNAGYGIKLAGLSSPVSNNIRITNNFFESIQSTAVTATYVNGLEISGNTLRLSSEISGLSLSSCKSIAGYPLRIANNKIVSFAQFGISLAACNTATSLPAYILNNYLEGGNFNSAAMAGISFTTSGSANICMWHNTVVIDNANPDTTSACIKILSGSTGLDVRNNLLAVLNPSSNAIPLFAASSAVFANLDFNDYFRRQAGNKNVKYVGTGFSASNYIGGAGFDSNSYCKDPLFANGYRLRRQCLVGTSLGVPGDIESNVRSGPNPLTGCYEFAAQNHDIGVIGILSPSAPLVAGAHPVSCRLYNFGLTNEVNFNIAYRYNLGSPVTLLVTDTLKQCDTLTVSFAPTQQVSISSGSAVLQLFTSMQADSNRSNDTVSIVLGTALSGTYTIGPTGNFGTILLAANALAARGISAPVVFNIQPGYYNDQVRIGRIPGSSVSNTVLFSAEDRNADSVIIAYSPSAAASNYVLMLEAGGFVSFRYITFKNTNSLFGRVIFLAGGNTHDTFQFCKIGSLNNSSNKSQYYLLTSNGEDSVIHISDNIFMNGSAGIYMNDGFPVSNSAQPYYNMHFSSEIYIERNVFRNFSYGIFLRNIRQCFIHSNQLSNISSSYLGIFADRIITHFSILNNKVNVYAHTGVGILVSGEHRLDSAWRSVIYNNTVNCIYHDTVVDNSATGALIALSISGLNDVDIYNNTLNIDGGGSANSFRTASFGSDTLLRLNFMNNVVTNFSPDANTFACLNSISSNVIVLIAVKMDYNLYYTRAMDVSASYRSTFFSSYHDHLVSLPGNDVNSILTHPAYTDSITDLRPDTANPYCWYLNGMGVQKPDLNFDIDSVSRPTLLSQGAPDLGAFEFTPSAEPPDIMPVTSTSSPNMQTFIAFNDTIAAINWVSTAPYNLKLKYYPGIFPNTSSLYHKMNCLYSFSDTNSFYYFDLALKYRVPQLGLIPYDTSIRMAQRAPGAAWNTVANSTVNVNSHTFSVTGYGALGEFTGTDMFAPLPVHLLSFTGSKAGEHVLLNWTLAAGSIGQIDVQKSLTGQSWKDIGSMNAAAGNLVGSNHFTDRQAFASPAPAVIYYRLKIRNVKDDSYSKTIAVTDAGKQGSAFRPFPNPFSDKLTVEMVKPFAGELSIQLLDITGKPLVSQLVVCSAADTEVEVNALPDLGAGVYFLVIEAGGEKQVVKLLKQ